MQDVVDAAKKTDTVRFGYGGPDLGSSREEVRANQGDQGPKVPFAATGPLTAPKGNQIDAAFTNASEMLRNTRPSPCGYWRF
jgi:hypothetical protein